MANQVSDIDANPFRPPLQQSDLISLSPDTEFLVSTECVLCGDELRLPPICIHTGDTDELIARESVLQWTPPWLVLLRAMLVGLVLPLCGSAMLWVANSGFSTRLPMRSLEAVPMLIVGAIFIATGFSIYLANRFTKRLTAVWYVECGADAKLKQQRRFWRAGLALFSIVLLGSLYWDAFVPLGLLSLLGLVHSVNRLRGLGQLCFSGRHMGLNVVTGLSPMFLRQVQGIIQNYDGERPS